MAISSGGDAFRIKTINSLQKLIFGIGRGHLYFDTGPRMGRMSRMGGYTGLRCRAARSGAFAITAKHVASWRDPTFFSAKKFLVLFGLDAALKPKPIGRYTGFRLREVAGIQCTHLTHGSLTRGCSSGSESWKYWEFLQKNYIICPFRGSSHSAGWTWEPYTSWLIRNEPDGEI